MFKRMTTEQLEKHIDKMELDIDLDSLLDSLIFQELENRYIDIETEEDRQKKEFQEKRIVRKLKKKRQAELEKQLDELISILA